MKKNGLNENNTAFLTGLLLKHAAESKTVATNIPGFSIARRDTPKTAELCVLNPVVLVCIQGNKRSIFGEHIVEYGAGKSMINSIDLPCSSQVIQASPAKPYLSMILKLDSYLIGQLIMEGAGSREMAEAVDKGIACADTDPLVLDAFTRLVMLLDNPEQIPVLSPLIIREIHYRLLTGPLGKSLRAINTAGSQSHRINRAIEWLKTNYREPLKIGELAELVNMAPSTLHRHFKQLTTMSPLQYQKRIRLHEAQRLMLTNGRDAAGAGYEVGYESPTQFSREYKRMFGEPPHRDIKRLTESPDTIDS